jgi:hypothetical protein
MKLRLVDTAPLLLAGEHQRILGQQAVAILGRDGFPCCRQSGDDLGAGQCVVSRVAQCGLHDRLHQLELPVLDRCRQAGEQAVRCECQGCYCDSDRGNDGCGRAAPECHGLCPRVVDPPMLCRRVSGNQRIAVQKSRRVAGGNGQQ